jgi:hypothetical protein
MALKTDDCYSLIRIKPNRSAEICEPDSSKGDANDIPQGADTLHANQAKSQQLYQQHADMRQKSSAFLWNFANA